MRCVPPTSGCVLQPALRAYSWAKGGEGPSLPKTGAVQDVSASANEDGKG